MIFGVLFTGVTGTMSGTNLSSTNICQVLICRELKDPGKSIPSATLDSQKRCIGKAFQHI